jgi:hypothetical protein
MDGAFGLVAGAGRAEFGRKPTDGRQDRHFFLLDAGREAPVICVKSGLFQLHFMSIAGLCQGRFMAAFGSIPHRSS